MVKTSEQLKNMAEDYIKITNTKYQNSTDQIREKNSDVDWQFVVGPSLHITMMKKRPDRILIHISVGFKEEDQKGVNQLALSDPEFINSINEIIMLSGFTHQWIKNKEGAITGININTYIDSEDFVRPSFYKEWDKLMSLQNHMARKIGIKLNPQQSKPTDSDTAGKSMYG